MDGHLERSGSEKEENSRFSSGMTPRKPAEPLKALAESGYVEKITRERWSRNARSVSKLCVMGVFRG
jgi:hypothetical protein